MLYFDTESQIHVSESTPYEAHLNGNGIYTIHPPILEGGEWRLYKSPIGLIAIIPSALPTQLGTDLRHWKLQPFEVQQSPLVYNSP